MHTVHRTPSPEHRPIVESFYVSNVAMNIVYTYLGQRAPHINDEVAVEVKCFIACAAPGHLPKRIEFGKRVSFFGEPLCEQWGLLVEESMGRMPIWKIARVSHGHVFAGRRAVDAYNEARAFVAVECTNLDKAVQERRKAAACAQEGTPFSGTLGHVPEPSEDCARPCEPGAFRSFDGLDDCVLVESNVTFANAIGWLAADPERRKVRRGGWLPGVYVTGPLRVVAPSRHESFAFAPGPGCAHAHDWCKYQLKS